ncbi:MAG: FKBP-type peptidyl-prolyl cis-trans isomerase [Bacteroidetes bacterium]|nr:FKBP-type peptidyl-prolyl cis-trans isomerase [Bacteroidota bacterium]
MQFILAAMLVVGISGCQSTGEKDVKLETKQDKVSYSIGLTVGNNLKRDSIMISPEAFLRGVLDARVDSAQRAMSDKEVQETMTAFQQEMQTKAQEREQAQALKNRTDGEAFLASNAKAPGVQVLPSGLQCKVITEGTGQKPQASSTVKVHYRGRLVDGTEFDSSFKRGEPAVFPVNGVIPGWTEALQLMKVGSKWEVYIPSHLAYGEQGAGGVIPPNATLIFEVELLEIQK